MWSNKKLRLDHVYQGKLFKKYFSELSVYQLFCKCLTILIKYKQCKAWIKSENKSTKLFPMDNETHHNIQDRGGHKIHNCIENKDSTQLLP